MSPRSQRTRAALVGVALVLSGCCLLPDTPEATPALPATESAGGAPSGDAVSTSGPTTHDASKPVDGGETPGVPAAPNAGEAPQPEAGRAEPGPDPARILEPRTAANGPPAWGVVGLRGYALGEQIAPNGLEFHPLFSLDVDLNLWLWRAEGVYLFSDTRFWGQKAAPGITNASQGVFDFSKREFDLDLGVAWNYSGPLEARAFAYSFNNLNRGTSEAHPSGYNDGVGLEQRWYVGGSYAELGQPGFDVTRANFLSVGYYPTKDMVDGSGNVFKPGPFLHAYLTLGPADSCWYLFSDTLFIATRAMESKLLTEDAGMAIRPFQRAQGFEFRLGAENMYDTQAGELETRVYLSARFIY